MSGACHAEPPAPRRVPAWLPATAFMALFFMGSGVFTPYLQLYFKERGLSALQIGTLSGVGPALSVLVPLVWGLLGDHSRRVRGLLALTSVLATAAFLTLPLSRGFLDLLALSALFSAFSLAGGPLSTSVILAEAERLGTDYGSLRLWGSVGFAAGILAAGRLVGGLGTAAIFPGYALPVLASLLPLLWMREAGARVGARLRWEQVWQALARRELQVLLLVSLLWRIAASGYYTFYTIFISGMGAGPGFVSIAWALGLVGEITVLRYSGRLAKRIGVRGLLALGLLGSAVRWLAYALAPTPGWTLPFQLLHGLTFGAMTTAAVLAVDRAFPSELRATGQGLLSAVMWGVGGLAGSVLAGYAVQALGMRWLYGLSAALAAATVLLTRIPREGADSR